MVKKAVTEKKRNANKENSSKSTGPRTEWGKLNSRFNAVKYGLFAEEVVIPDCDGEDASRKFSELLLDLQVEIEPNGRVESVLVEIAAAGIWRTRRATRAEFGATRIDGFWDNSHELPKDSFIDKLNRSVDIERACLQALNEAREEIRHTGTLCTESCKKIRPLLEKEPVIAATNDPDTTSESAIDDDFVRRLEEKIASLQFTILQIDGRVATRYADSLKKFALPPTEEIEKISRCRMRGEKEFAWALHTLYALRKKRGNKKPRNFSNTDGRKQVEDDGHA